MAMQFPKGKFISLVKVGEKGQIVIPKGARELFGIQPGDQLLLMADKKRGIALVDEDVALLPFDLHIDRTRGGHVGHALVVGQVGLHQTVFFACALLDDSLFEEASEDF